MESWLDWWMAMFKLDDAELERLLPDSSESEEQASSPFLAEPALTSRPETRPELNGSTTLCLLSIYLLDFRPQFCCPS